MLPNTNPTKNNAVLAVDPDSAAVVKAAIVKATSNNSNKPQQTSSLPSLVKIWLDEKPPESLDKSVYHSIEHRLGEIERISNKMDKEYGIDGHNLFHYVRETALHLNRLRSVCGVNEVNSDRIVRHLVKVVKFNLKLAKQWEEEKMAQEAKESEDSKESIAKFIKENCGEEEDEEAKRTKQDLMDLPGLDNKEDTEISSKAESVKAEPLTQAPITNDSNVVKESKVEEPKHSQQTLAKGSTIEEMAEDEDDLTKSRKEKLLKQQQPIGINISQSLSYLSKNKKKQVEIDIDQITSDEQISPLLKQVKRKYIKVTEDTKHDLDVMEQVFASTEEFLKTFAVRVLNQVEVLNSTCDKYFWSFIEESFDSFHENKTLGLSDKSFEQSKQLLDSALKYQQKRKVYFKSLRRILKALRYLNEKFHDQTTKDAEDEWIDREDDPRRSGLSLQMFSDETRLLSDRYDCDLIQLILIIPEHSSLVKQCLQTFREWLDYDRSYASYILSDMKETDRKKKNLNSMKHLCELSYNQLLHRIRLLKQTLEHLEIDMNELFKKTRETVVDEEEDYYLIAQSELIPKISQYKLLKYENMDCRMMLDSLSSDLDDQESEVNNEVHWQKLIVNTGGNHKLNKFEVDEKFKHLEKMRAKVNELEDYLVYLYQVKKIKQDELDVLESCYVKLKEIYINKISSETLEKIFYGLPLPSFKLVTNGSGNSSSENSSKENNYANSPLCSLVFHNNYDPFQVYFRVISKMLLNNWIKFYYSLPFYPERGMQTKKKRHRSRFP